MTVPVEARASLAQVEYAIARRSFVDFLSFCSVLDPDKGVIPFEVWPHIRVTCETIGKFRLVVILKPKQVGMSWTAADLALWGALYHDGDRTLLYSRGEMESRELLAKVRFTYDHLAPWLRVPLKGEGNTQEMRFQQRDSQILALPSTKAAGVGFAATRVIMDEADFHEYLAENYDTAAKPTIDAGGQIILLSTANPANMVSPFRTLYRGAGDEAPGANGFVRLFFPWDVRPGRDEKWRASGRLAAMDAAVFDKNYPRSAEEALAPAQTLAAFDLEALEKMRSEVKAPVAHIGKANVYAGYIVGRTYAAASDTGHGVGQDYSVTVVKDVSRGAIVADLVTNVLPPEAFTLESVALLRAFDEPLWAPEDNEWGIAVIQRARDLGYRRLYNRDQTGKTEKWGWHTDDKTRWPMWTKLREAVGKGAIVIPSREGLDQFLGVILNPERGGRPEAMTGAHDDYPTAVGIVGEIEQYAKPSGQVRKPVVLGRMW